MQCNAMRLHQILSTSFVFLLFLLASQFHNFFPFCCCDSRLSYLHSSEIFMQYCFAVVLKTQLCDLTLPPGVNLLLLPFFFVFGFNTLSRNEGQTAKATTKTE
jgi:hypothetical protein